jgi:D-alanyl-D-alanine-carboxypeptidase/D-alanyl-D-alanine-endopeptidase
MRFLAASLLFLGLSTVLAQSVPQINLQDLKDEEALGSELYTNSGATGLVLVVVRNDKVFIHGYGETAPGSHIAPSENSLIRLCSLTKIFTTDMLAKLVADGTVHLDDPLQKYAPAGVRVPEMGEPITLLDLATHTAGLDREIATAPRRTPHFTYPDYRTRWQWLPTAELKFTPGTQAFYSNVGFDLLSDALADAARTPYPTLLWSRTLKPLQMWETSFYPSAAQCARLMQGPRNEGPCTVTENTQGSSGLYSTPEDMAKWLRYLVRSEAPLPAKAGGVYAVYLLPSSLKSISGLSHAGRPSGIGLGWMHLDANDDGSHIIEKTGGGAGFTTYIAIHPASHSAIFVAATDGPPRANAPGFRLFQASTNGLLALAGLPPRPNVLRRPVPLTRIAANRIAKGRIIHATAHRSRRTMRASIRMRRPAKRAATAAEVSSK